MTTQQLFSLVPRFVMMGAFLAATAALTGCAGDASDSESDGEDVVEVESAIGPVGDNNYPPYAVDSDPVKRSVTDSFGITSSTNPDLLPLCQGGTVTSTGCTLKNEWGTWMAADPTNRVPTMIAIAKCAVSSSFTISTATASFPGQWGLYNSWKTTRLNGADKRERISSCMLSLLNGNNVELDLCIIGPGGAPFTDACSDTSLNNREGGFFGDLFAPTPTAYVAGPDTKDPVDSGRVCTRSSGTSYCCAESDTSCTHRVILAGAIVGDPATGYANKRCNGSLVSSGGNYYCTSFYSTREPTRSYTNVFTSFVPVAP